MLPSWMERVDQYDPPKDGSKFAVKTIQTIGKAMSRIKVQKGHEKGRPLPALFKLLVTAGGILFLSITQNKLCIMAYAAILLLYLCTWPARDILNIMKAGCGASVLASGIRNELLIVIKVFFSISTLSIFNHTTQWNHITGALRKLHIPGIFIFTLDITLKYIVLLGNLITELLTSLQLRSVGKNNKKYSSIGGVMGVTFVRGTEMNQQMYEAMQCRGFTDDYSVKN